MLLIQDLENAIAYASCVNATHFPESSPLIHVRLNHRIQIGLREKVNSWFGFALQLWLLAVMTHDVVPSLLTTQVNLLEVGQISQHICSRQVVAHYEMLESMTLRARETLLMEEEIDHDVGRVKCDCAQLVRKDGRLEVQLSANIVEQSETLGDLDMRLLFLLEGVGHPAEDSAVILEHRLLVLEGLVANLDRLRPQRILVNPVANLCWKTQER
jgi:hypothetical protein